MVSRSGVVAEALEVQRLGELLGDDRLEVRVHLPVDPLGRVVEERRPGRVDQATLRRAGFTVVQGGPTTAATSTAGADAPSDRRRFVTGLLALALVGP